VAAKLPRRRHPLPAGTLRDSEGGTTARGQDDAVRGDQWEAFV